MRLSGYPFKPTNLACAFLRLETASVILVSSTTSSVCEKDGNISCHFRNDAVLNNDVDLAQTWNSIVFGTQMLAGMLMVRYFWSWILWPVLHFVALDLALRCVAVGLLRDKYVVFSVRTLRKLLKLRNSKPTPSIDLSGCVTDDEAEILGDTICNQSAGTRFLSLRENPDLSSNGVEVLCKSLFGQASNLSSVDLSINPQLGDRLACVLFAGASAWSRTLQSLQLMHCGLSKNGMDELSSAVETSALKVLHLSFNRLSGSGQFLARICGAPQLEQLGLESCSLSDEDVKEMASELPYSSVKGLDLGSNSLTDCLVLAGHIQEAPLLTLLDLSHNSIPGGEGLGRLAAAWAEVPERVSRGILDIDGNLLSQKEVEQFHVTLSSLV